MRQEGTLIIIENKRIVLSLCEDGTAVSLICRETGEECLADGERLPLFSVTEARPFNNEIKLAHPNKQMTFSACHIRTEGNYLRISFDLVHFDAIVEVCEREDYITFRLARFDVPDEAFPHLSMDTPPVIEMRLLQLPVRRRRGFGDWLNAVTDENTSVAVIATSPSELIDAEQKKDHVVLCADAEDSILLCGATAALIACPTPDLLSVIGQIEEDFELPRGVESRRSSHLARSIYWTEKVDPTNVDLTIECAKMCGLKNLLIYYPALFKSNGYALCGNYLEKDLRDEYPEGFASVSKMLEKIRAAGITPGLHILHTHIGIKSRYVTPVADHRLNLKHRFTLSRPLDTEETTVYVEENPRVAPMCDGCRVLQFGGEIISYTGYSTEAPYRFTGCKRGHYDTNVTTHERGQIGGTVDVSEYCAISVYVDQNSSLQDEIAQQLATVYDLGFEFIYFDGSEGTNAPYNYHVSNAQYRVLKKLKTPPIFCEGAAKTHFGWHWMSGGNAFDVFPAPIFKEKIVEHPFEEAPRMANDFTALNFGWWRYANDMMPDMYEYGLSLSTAWDCPATVMLNDPTAAMRHPRAKDIFEVFRRWEDARETGAITKADRLALRKTEQEHVLLINEEGKYELSPYTRVAGAAQGDARLVAYVFSRRKKNYALLFHTEGEGALTLPLPADTLVYERDLGGEHLSMLTDGSSTTFIVGERRYLSTDGDMETLVRALESATLSEC